MVGVRESLLQSCFEHNSDGVGFMLPIDGNIVIYKGVTEFQYFLYIWRKVRKQYPDLPVVFHFRYATMGAVDWANCHPHRIARDLGFVHNGTLQFLDIPIGGVRSDSVIYRDRYLRHLDGGSSYDQEDFPAMERQIGKANKFVFMNGNGKVVICNEDQGEWAGGIWLSRKSFSLFGRRYGRKKR